MAAVDKDNLIEILVADSVAFLKNVPLQNIAKNVYTINEVVGEIKSAAVRQRLAVLPYEITFRVPSSDSLHVVSEFAKMTGDFQSLSLVDLKVLALTYQLCKEKCGTDGLRAEPTRQVVVVDKSPQGKVPGFYVKSKSNEGTNKDDNAAEHDLALDSEKMNLIEDISRCSLNGKDVDQSNHNNVKDDAFENEQEDKQARTTNDIPVEEKECLDVNDIKGGTKANGYGLDTADNVDQVNDGQILHDCEDKVNDCKLGNDDNCDDNDMCSSNDDDVNDDGDDDDDDDDGDWITPDNINQVKADYGISEAQSRPTDITVGCLTTDFAMQNVLIQMGLHVISVEGMLIKEARSYVLKCYSCFKVTTEMTRMFCPKCGNRTLVKVSVSVNEEGITRYHMPKRKKPFNIRGKKHPLPLPKGGRHNKNPLLFEDQLISQRRLPRTKDKVNVFDEDYVARSSPFAVNDTTSRAFNLGFHVRGQNKRNPNDALCVGIEWQLNHNMLLGLEYLKCLKYAYQNVHMFSHAFVFYIYSQ